MDDRSHHQRRLRRRSPLRQRPAALTTVLYSRWLGAWYRHAIASRHGPHSRWRPHPDFSTRGRMKQKQQIIVLIVLVVVAALVWTFELRQQTSSAITTSFITDYKPLGEDNPGIHWDQLGRAQKTEYKSNGRNPFSPIAPPTADDLKKAHDDAAKLQASLPALPIQTPPPTRA